MTDPNPGPKSESRSHSFRGIGAIVVFFGAWTALVQVLVMCGGSFTHLLWLSPLAPAAALAWWFGSRGEPRPGEAESPPQGSPGETAAWGWIVAPPLVIALAWFLSGSRELFWFLSVAYLLWLAYRHRGASSGGGFDGGAAKWAGPAIVLVAVVACLAVFVSNRPDLDDAYYLNVAVVALDHPDRAIQSFDGMHREGLPPVEQILHASQSYELLIGALARWTGLSTQTLYYLVFPLLFAALGVLVHAIALRQFLGRNATALAVAGLTLVLLAWGDGHRTLGNFAFVRMHQGKAVLLWVFLPLIWLLARRFLKRPTTSTWVLLMASQLAATGFSTNGQLMAPLASSLVLLAGIERTSSSWRRVLVGALASVPVVPILFYVWARFPARAGLEVDPALAGITTVFGEGWRGPLTLVAILGLPGAALLAGLAGARWLTRYVAVVLLLVFNPLLIELLKTHVAVALSWRILWAVPVPLLLGLFLGACASAKSRPRRIAGAAIASLWLLAFALAGPWTLSEASSTTLQWGGNKVPEDAFAVAERVVEQTEPDDLVLAPEWIASYVTGFRSAPRLVGTRPLYLRKMLGEASEADLLERIRLVEFVGGVGDPRARSSSDEVLAAIRRREIDTIVLAARGPDVAKLVSELRLLGFEREQLRGYRIFSR